ncbi:MAG: hypothetical protein AAF678_04565 [Pseudomonadota bacterium]
MKFLNIVCAGLALAVAAPGFVAPASAQSAQDVLPLTTDKLEKARTWDKWTITRNLTRGHCIGTKADDSGTLQMGVTADETMGYVGVFVPGEVDPGIKELVIEVGEQTFTGTSSGPVGNLGTDLNGGYVLANNQNFRKAIEANEFMTVYPDTASAVQLNIKGANAAIFEIAKCSQKLAG